MTSPAPILHAAFASAAFITCLLCTSCGSGGDGHSDDPAPPSTVGTLVLPGLSLTVERLANAAPGSTAYRLTAADASPVASMEILSGSEWQSAISATVARQADASWETTIPSGDQNLFVRFILTDGNIVESGIAAR